MSAPGGLRRRVPLWIWLPLVLALAAGVTRLKIAQLEQRSRVAHEGIYAEAAEREARFRWMDSLVRANAPARQRELMARVDSACARSDRGEPANDTVNIGAYRDAAKRVTDWAAEVTVRDTALQLRSGLLYYDYDGPWSDDVRRMAIPQHRHAVRFSARISFAEVDVTCSLEFVVRDLAMTRIDATPPSAGEAHAGH